jgi:LmeA-like phospholipid-binding
VFILFRLVRLVVFLVLIVVVLGVIAFVLGRPFVERLAARSIEDRIGTPVSVSIGTSLRPGIVRGDLGKVTVKATQFERDGLRLAGARATYRGVSVGVSDLISGDVRLHYASVGFQAKLTQAALAAYLRPLLSERGLPSKKLRVTIAKGRAQLRVGTLHAAVRATIVGRSTIKLVPVSGTATLRRALATSIQLGPLPDGVHLTGIALRSGSATIAGSGEGGELQA